MEPEILIVDNDPILSTLSSELLQDAGFVTQSLPDGSQAINVIRDHRPRAVLLDIMMPGIDGLSICRAIKADEDLSSTKVIVVSAKSYETEKARATKYGADMYIAKPYDIDTFASQIIQIVGQPANPGAAAAVKTTTPFSLRVWGFRSVLESGPQDLPTPCVSLATAQNIFIFDAGTGIIPLGRELVQEGKFKDIWLFLTHFHPDHVKGLGLFPCMRDSRFKVHIAGPNDPEKSLEQCVREAIEASFSSDPMPIAAQMQLYDLQQGNYDLLPGVKLQTIYANHPSTTLSYSIKTKGRHFVYCPDNELRGEGASAFEDTDEVLGKMVEEADLMIHDARYADDDFDAHRNQGHSSLTGAVHFAMRHDVKRLLLFHADGIYGDVQRQGMEVRAKALAQQEKSSIHIQCASDGLSLKF